MQVGPYTYSDELRIRLELLGRGAAQLQQAGVYAGAAGQAIQKELHDLFVYHSAGIQGNRMTLPEVLAVIDDHAVLEGPSRHEQIEVVNLAHALEYVTMLAEDDLPLAERLIRIIHALVMRGLLPPGEEPGTYRNQDMPELAYGPPAAYAVTGEMGALARWLAARPGTAGYEPDAVVRGAAAHSWLLTIHPFLNGNGRVARLLLNLILLKAGYPLAVLHAEDRPRYMAALEAAGLEHDLTPTLALVVDRLNESMALYSRLVSS
jgi:Fic family protein